MRHVERHDVEVITTCARLEHKLFLLIKDRRYQNLKFRCQKEESYSRNYSKFFWYLAMLLQFLCTMGFLLRLRLVLGFHFQQMTEELLHSTNPIF